MVPRLRSVSAYIGKCFCKNFFSGARCGLVNTYFSGATTDFGYTFPLQMTQALSELVRRINFRLAPQSKVVTKTLGKDSINGKYVLLDIKNGTKHYLSLAEVRDLDAVLNRSSDHQ